MDLKAFPPEIILERTDKISISFFDCFSFETRQKLNQTELKRLFDNLFYFLSMCSKEFAFVDKNKELVQPGNLEFMIQKLNECIGELKQTDPLTLGLSLNEKSDINQILHKLCGEFEIDNLNYDYLGKKISVFLERVLSPLFKNYIDSSSSHHASIDTYLDEQIQAFQKLLSQSATGKLRSQSQDLISLMKSRDSFDENKKTEVTENLDQTLENQLKKIHQEFSVIEGALKQSLQSAQSKSVELRFLDLQKLINQIAPEEKLPKEATESENHVGLIASKKHVTSLAEIQGEHVTKNGKLTFLPFFRVKEVSSPSHLTENNLISLNNNLVNDNDSNDSQAMVGSLSFHICDIEDKTLSFSEELSQEEAVIKISDYWASKIQNRKSKPDIQSPNPRVNVKYSKSFTDSAKEIDTTPNNAPHRYQIHSASVSTESAISFSSLINLLKPLDANIEYVINDSSQNTESSLKSFFDNLYTKIHAIEIRNEELASRIEGLQSSKKMEVELSNSLQAKIQQLEFTNKSISDILKGKEDETVTLHGKLDHVQHEISVHIAHIDSLTHAFKDSNARSNLDKLRLSNNLLGLSKNLKRISPIAGLTDKERKLMNEIFDLAKIIKGSYHNKLSAIINEKDKIVSQLEEQLNVQSQTINAQKTVLSRRETRISTILNKIIKMDIQSETMTNEFKKKLSNMVDRWERHLMYITKLVYSVKKSNEFLEYEKKDLSYMNSNLIKELGVLSDSVNQLTIEKEKLEDQVSKETDFEEKNLHLKLKIEVLKEKLDLASSLKDIAEKNLENAIEDRNNPFNFQSKNYLTTPFEAIQPHYLRTIDENDELSEGFEIQEGSQLRENHSANTKENNLNTIDYLQSPKVNEYQISLPCNYLFVQSWHNNSFILSAHESKRSPREIGLSPKDQNNKMKDPKKSKILFIDNKNFDQYIQFDNDLKIEDKAQQDDKTPTETRKLRDPNSLFTNEQNSSQKKKLFSMQNVLKNISNPTKPNQSIDYTQKNIHEFKVIEESNVEVTEIGRKESQPNTALDECQSSYNNTEYNDVYNIKDIPNNSKPIFISSGSNKVIRFPEPSPRNNESNISKNMARQIISKQYEKINHLSTIIERYDKMISLKVINLKQKIGNISEVYNKQIENVIELNNQQQNTSIVQEEVVYNRSKNNQFLSMSSHGQIFNHKKSEMTSVSLTSIPVREEQNDIHIGRLQHTQIILEKHTSTSDIDLASLTNNVNVAHETNLNKKIIKDNQTLNESDSLAFNQSANNVHQTTLLLEEEKKENQNLREQINTMNQELENLTGLNSEYEAVLDYTFNVLKTVISLDESDELSKNHNIQEILDIVSKEFIKMKNRIDELNDYLQEQKAQSQCSHMKENRLSNLSLDEDELERQHNLQINASKINLNSDDQSQKLFNSGNNSKNDQPNEEVEDVEELPDYEQLENPEINNSNNDKYQQMDNQELVEYDFQDFKEKQTILKEGFNDLLTNILCIIDDNFEHITETGSYIEEFNNEIMMKLDNKKASNVNVFKKEFANSMDRLYQNNTNLKEMTEFLSSNLMKFISEIDAFRDHIIASLPQNEQFKDLIQENDFLYHKLNESNKQIEYLMFHIQKYEEQHPDIAKIISKSIKRAYSVPNLSFHSDSDQIPEKNPIDLQEKIKDFMNNLFNHRDENIIRIADKDQSHIYLDSQRNTNNFGNEKEFIGSERDLDQDQNPENKVEILENYNIFLMQLLKQMKTLIDDRNTPVKIRMGKLSDISKDLDEM